MNKHGFFIKKVQVEGGSKEIRSARFRRGLNVIYGPSDTGKTLIYQCIDYMLGSSKRPKDMSIPEIEGYSLCKLEIESFNGDTFLLERALKGGDIKLYDKDNNLVDTLKIKNDKKSEKKTISDFLLELCNIESKEIRKNNDAQKQMLYFQDISKYFLIDEETIIIDKSPISIKPDRGFNASATFEKNVFKFLLTGEDDSAIITLLKKDEVANKTGKVQLYDELITQLELDLKDIDYEKIDEEIEKLNEKIESFRESYLTSSLEFKKYDKEKKVLFKKISLNESNLINLNEILTRSNILKKQYISDIERLKGTIEASQGLSLITTTSCPICTGTVEETVNIEELINATSVEIQKTTLLLKELESSSKIYLSEQNELNQSIVQDKKHYEEVIVKIQNQLSEVLAQISNKIKKYTSKKEELSKIKTLKEKLDSYREEKDKIEKIIKNDKASKKTSNYDELTVVLLNPIITLIKNILVEMKFDNIDNKNIGFSEELLDFSVGEKNRKAFGKGYRAILYAVFVISLLEYFRTKPYQIGFTMIDSPLNPYKEDEKKDDGVVPINLGEQFYRYLYNNIKNEQVILIENTEVPIDIKEDINYIVFDKLNGFLPNVSGV
ncbi:hypothetical protein [Malaciobacter marinus]|uniref:hypothetical protein n=1 Tax=Malaciobacter marinus TaxID=505249 RepID=UPI003B0078AD